MGVRALSMVVAAALLVALFFVLGSSAAFASECANETRREEQNATYLPDCRAYEMVSPLDKNGSDLIGDGPVTEASVDGERLAYAADAGFAGTTGSGAAGFTQYLAVREGTGWRSRGITPTPAKEAFQFFAGATANFLLSDDLSHSIAIGRALPGSTGGIPKGENFYAENNETGALQTVTQDLGSETLETFTVSPGTPIATSADLGEVTFSLTANLLPELTGSESKVYAWDHNGLSVAGILPDGSIPAGGATLARSSFGVRAGQGTVSRDGSRIAFMSPESGSGKQLYLYHAGKRSAWVSQSEASTPDPEPQNVTFEAMTPDGRKVLFATTDKLLDSDPGGAALGLYMYTDSPDPEGESNLSFIARVNGSQAESLVAGMSEDGKRIYFFTEEAPGFAKTGTYLWDEGTTHFVAPTLQPLERPGYQRQAEVSADGRRLAFLVKEQLEGAVGVETSFARMYVYDETREALKCVSCSDQGIPVGSNAEVEPEATKTFGLLNTGFRVRFLASDGRWVFFSTDDPLVSQDTNGLYDVYEYDVETGETSLLSTGTGDDGTWLAAASASGDDAFLATRNSLVGQDADTLVDLYDARVGGGFVEPAPSTGGCIGDECQGVPSAAPSFNVASGFSGLGNVAAASQKATARHKSLTRAQQLARALRACKHKPSAKRHRCEAGARKKYRRVNANKSTAASLARQLKGRKAE